MPVHGAGGKVQRDRDIRTMAALGNRRSIRLKGYDYTQPGAYYVTVCTHQRARSFGHITDGAMHRSPIGNIVQACWDAIPEHMPHAACDAFVVMPDHVHGIVVITGTAADGTLGGGDTAVGSTDPSTLPHTAPDGNPDHSPPAGDHAVRRPRIAIMPRNSLGHIVQSFKAAVSRQVYRDGLVPRGTPVWQRNYYERIIRDQDEWDRIALYIAENPGRWNGQGPFEGLGDVADR